MTRRIFYKTCNRWDNLFVTSVCVCVHTHAHKYYLHGTKSWPADVCSVYFVGPTFLSCGEFDLFFCSGSSSACCTGLICFHRLRFPTLSLLLHSPSLCFFGSRAYYLTEKYLLMQYTAAVATIVVFFFLSYYYLTCGFEYYFGFFLLRER